MATVVVVVVVLVAIALLVRFFVGARGPEQAATHEGSRPADETRSDRVYGGTDRPAGPDAEMMDVPEHRSSPSGEGDPGSGGGDAPRP